MRGAPAYRRSLRQMAGSRRVRALARSEPHRSFSPAFHAAADTGRPLCRGRRCRCRASASAPRRRRRRAPCPPAPRLFQFPWERRDEMRANHPRQGRRSRRRPRGLRFQMLDAGAGEVGEVDEEIGALLGFFGEIALMGDVGGAGVDRRAAAIASAIGSVDLGDNEPIASRISGIRCIGRSSETASASISRDRGKMAQRSRTESARSMMFERCAALSSLRPSSPS